MAAQSCWVGTASRRFMLQTSRGFIGRTQHIALKPIASTVAVEGKWFRALNTSATRGTPSQVLMPALSPTMEEGTIVKWLKKEGDTISPGDDLCEIETDKATVTLDTEEEGVLAKIIIPEGTRNVKISKLIALIAEEGEDISKVEIPTESQAPADKTTITLDTSQTDHTSAVSSGSLSPAVRLLLETYQLDSRLIPATGPKGRLLKGDVLRFVAQGGRPFAKPEELAPTVRSTSSAPPVATAIKQNQPAQGPEPSVTAEHTDFPLTSMRRTIAKRLTESKASIPHAYAVADCKMDKLLALRAQMKQHGTIVSVNDFIIKAAAVALTLVPKVNAVLKPDGEAQLQSAVDISVAVATDSGLITPIIRDAAGLEVAQISSTLKDLATRARDGKLQLHEFQGGSFTISNLGMFGITEFSAVINPPQACIMAVGGTKAVFSTDETIHKVMRVTLSCDGRIVNERLATEWLEAFRNNIENPEQLGL